MPLTCVIALIDILVHDIVEKVVVIQKKAFEGMFTCNSFFNFPTASLRYSGQYLLEIVLLNGSE